MSIAHVDIENAKTKLIETYDLNILENDGKDSVFDISTLNDQELKKIKDAINVELFYTDIELFYIDDSSVPYFGTDYKYEIKNGKLYAFLKEKMRKYMK